jgi:predicted nucleotide-binding protein
MLPIRTTLTDIDALCGYLITKPTGATVVEARAVIDEKVLDGRKVSALKTWGLISETANGKICLTELGRLISKDKGARRAQALKRVVASIVPYSAIVERAIHRSETTLTATEVAAHWHQHFKTDASDSDKVLNDQALCFFQVAEGADLGKLIYGRKGQSTRFEFDDANARAFISERQGENQSNDAEDLDINNDSMTNLQPNSSLPATKQQSEHGNKVFITHGKNKKILEQVKELVAFGKFEPVVAQEREAAAKPVPDKVMDEMRSCNAAVIHVGNEGVLLDSNGKEFPQINGNVLIEIGAAMALYGRNFILLVEDGVNLPSNLQGLYECRYSGDELNMPATMKLLKAFNEFR